MPLSLRSAGIRRILFLCIKLLLLLFGLFCSDLNVVLLLFVGPLGIRHHKCRQWWARSGIERGKVGVYWFDVMYWYFLLGLNLDLGG